MNTTTVALLELQQIKMGIDGATAEQRQALDQAIAVMTSRVFSPFRKPPQYTRPYPMDLYLACVIPADTDPNDVPCSAIKTQSGTTEFIGSLGYNAGDANWAQELAKVWKAKNPTWTVELRRVDNGKVVWTAGVAR